MNMAIAMDFLSNYGLFLLKVLTMIIGFLLTFVGILALTRKSKPEMEIHSVNKEYKEMAKRVRHEVVGKEPKKKPSKADIKAQKTKPNLFVCEFIGDLRATQVDTLRNIITAILSIASEKDEVVI